MRLPLTLLPALAVMITGMQSMPAPKPDGLEIGVPADTIPVANASLSFSLDRLLVPVAGLGPSDLRDSFRQGRSGGRRHNAIDIMAPHGTPVIAASSGTIAHKGFNRLGGRVLYVLTPDGRYALYYAHLDGYAGGIEDGTIVSQGDTLGYVGSTGNARAPHLHFQVLEVRPGRHPHSGSRPVNPYTLLRESRLYDESPPAVRG
jgi:murein DD-endopeptidase MepM/ murein hydrolase activator NlpD